MRFNPNHLLLLTALIVGIACKSEGAQNDRSVIWTYEMTGTYSDGAKKEIGARYEYGSRAASMSSSSGNVSVKPKTAGPKRAMLNITAPPSAGGGTVNCTIVVKKDGTKFTTIRNTGKNTITCTFTP